MNSVRLAGILSILLGPHVWLPTLLIVSLFRSGLTSSQIYILFPILFLFQVLIPLAYIHIALHLGKVSAWDLPNKKERYLFLVITLTSYLISTAFIYFLGNKLLLNLSFIILFSMITMVGITYFWKISLHSSINTAGSILVNFLFNWNMPWLYLTIPVIIWARLKLKRHNISQLISGVLVSGGIMLGALYYLDYI